MDDTLTHPPLVRRKPVETSLRYAAVTGRQ